MPKTIPRGIEKRDITLGRKYYPSFSLLPFMPYPKAVFILPLISLLSLASPSLSVANVFIYLGIILFYFFWLCLI